MTKKVQWSYTLCPVLWVLSGLWLVGWASRGSLAVTGSQVSDALLTRFSMFAVHSLITRGIVSQWGHGQRAWRSRNNRLLGLLYSPMRPFVSSRPRNDLILIHLWNESTYKIHLLLQVWNEIIADNEQKLGKLGESKFIHMTGQWRGIVMFTPTLRCECAQPASDRLMRKWCILAGMWLIYVSAISRIYRVRPKCAQFSVRLFLIFRSAFSTFDRSPNRFIGRSRFGKFVVTGFSH